MSWKKFLKPDWRKAVIFLILTILSSIYQRNIGVGELFIPSRGLPLPVYMCAEGFSDIILLTPLMMPCEIIYPFLIINLIMWYLLACLIVWIYDKVKKK